MGMNIFVIRLIFINTIKQRETNDNQG